MNGRFENNINKIIHRYSRVIKDSFKSRILPRLILYAVSGLFLLQLMLVLSVLSGVFGKIPGKPELQGIASPLASEVYTADSVLMGKYYIQNRQYLDHGQITNELRDALISTEDIRFYSHNGIDFKSLGRVFIKTILLGDEGSGGGSTLTQQLVKNLYPRRDHGFLSLAVNKVWEMATALRVEKVYTKDEILELYLATVPFGENTFGIKSASVRFFNKEPRRLKLEESALLVGMLKATGTYNPVRNPVKATLRRNLVLEQMAGYNLKRQVADSLKTLPLEISHNPLPHNAGIAPYFREFLRRDLHVWCRRNNKADGEHYDLYSDGLKIYTGIDSRLQHYADMAVKDHMSRLQKIFEEHWKGHDMWKGISNDQLMINYGREYREEMSTEAPRKMDVFTWEGTEEREYNTIDSLKHYLEFLQTGLLAMEVATGEIKAWVGGINNEYWKYDHVLARRQPGSAFKPLVYLSALEQGVSPCDYFPNDSIVYHDYDDWTPRNADRRYGGYYSLKGALVNSVNTVSVNLMMESGTDSVIALARRAGIESPLPAVPSLALGTAGVSLLEMTGVYQAIANRGLAKKPVYIRRIEDKDGNILFENPVNENPGRQVCDPANAEIMVEMLRGVVNEGTAASLRSAYGLEEDVAGKTGTSQDYTDGWFIGFTPRLVAGVWVGGDLQNLRFREMSYGQGAFSAMPLWAGFMKKTLSHYSGGSMEGEMFGISDHTKDLLSCDDYRENKPLRFEPFRWLKEESFLKRLFKKKKR